MWKYIFSHIICSAFLLYCEIFLHTVTGVKIHRRATISSINNIPEKWTSLEIVWGSVTASNDEILKIRLRQVSGITQLHPMLISPAVTSFLCLLFWCLILSHPCIVSVPSSHTQNPIIKIHHTWNWPGGVPSNNSNSYNASERNFFSESWRVFWFSLLRST